MDGFFQVSSHNVYVLHQTMSQLMVSAVAFNPKCEEKELQEELYFW